MFVHLDGAWAIGQAFVLGYRFTDASGELWTGRFNAFKAGEERAVLAGIAVMRSALATVQAPKGPTIVIGVPGSSEVQLASGRPVARLAESVAKLWGAKLDLKLIQKDRHDPLHRKRTVSARREVLDGANYRTTRQYKDVKNYILVDDLVTRGDTMQRIATAINKDIPDAKFMAIAIAKTDKLQWYLENGRALPDNTAAAGFNAIWVKAESAK